MIETSRPVADSGGGDPEAMASQRYSRYQHVAGTERATLGAELARRYRDGESTRQLAASIGKSHWFVSEVLRDSGVQLRGRGGRRRDPSREPSDTQLSDRYMAGASIRDLARETGSDYGTVRRVLLRAGVKLRGRGGNVRHRRG